MALIRSATVATSMAFMLSLGPALATTNSHSPFSLTDDRTLDLRATGSQLVVDTVEDALRQGGLALFDEGFQLDSSLNWVFGENIEGEIDAVVPLWSGGGHAVFVQPGFVFWTGLADEERIDGNLGIAYRTGLTKDVIGGASIFYDRDFKQGHSRISFGGDMQSGFLHGAANYYQPLSDEEDGREGFVEEALRGMDFRLAIQRDIMRVSGNLGYWRFEGDDAVEADWKISYGLDAGIRIFPGVFLEGGWERHDEDVSLDSRWNAGLAFRFSLPDFRGASYGDGSMSSNLYQIVEREKRILYDERLGLPVASLSLEEGSANVAEGETRILTVELSEEIDEAITLNLALGGTATFRDDYTVAGDGMTVACADNGVDLVCPFSFASGATEASVEVSIVDDGSVVAEGHETISLNIAVPDQYSRLLKASGSVVLTIGGSGNTVSIASTSDTTLDEDRGMAEVAVNVDRPASVPITLDIEIGGTADSRNFTINPRSLTIPAEQSSGTITLTGINNDDVDERGQSIILTIRASGTLPDGWTLGNSEHTVNILDDETAVGFSATMETVEEPASTIESYQGDIAIRLTRTPSADLTVEYTLVPQSDFGSVPGLPADAVAATTIGGSADITFPSSKTFTFTAGTTTLSQALTNIDIIPDNNNEPDEYVVLKIEPNNSFTAGGNQFNISPEYFIIRIPAND